MRSFNISRTVHVSKMKLGIYTHGKKSSNPNILSLKTRYNTANRKATLKYIKSSLLYKSMTLSQYIHNRKMVQWFEIHCHNAEERCAPFLVKNGACLSLEITISFSLPRN